MSKGSAVNKAQGNGLFRLSQRTARFELDGAYEGAWVVCNLSVPLSKLFEVERIADDEAEEDDRRRGARFFAQFVVQEWNLADEEGNPLPISEESVMGLPFDLGVALIAKWSETAKGIPGPLGKALAAGKQPQEAPISEGA